MSQPGMMLAVIKSGLLYSQMAMVKFCESSYGRN